MEKKIRMQIKHILKQDKVQLGIGVVIVFIMVLAYSCVIYARVARNEFAIKEEKIATENKQPIFKIDKIFLHNSADAIDNSPEQNLQDVTVYQYSDIGIYINNTCKEEKLTEENTIKEMYIDHIQLSVESGKGEPILNYKNPHDFAKFRMLENAANQRIDFKVINTNEANVGDNYEQPTFYTDCSNPISLGYINKNIVEHFTASKANNSLAFNGKILGDANLALSDMTTNISFRIHIKNNLNQEFKNEVNFKLLSEENDSGIYAGYVTKIIKRNDFKYNFFKQP